METVTGYVTGINGNLANVSFEGAVHKNEVGYILVDGKRLKGEVIRINNGVASMQIYEMSNGIKVGDPVEFTGELMSVELGPGLLTQVFDCLLYTSHTYQKITIFIRVLLCVTQRLGIYLSLIHI